MLISVFLILYVIVEYKLLSNIFQRNSVNSKISTSHCSYSENKRNLSAEIQKDKAQVPKEAEFLTYLAQACPLVIFHSQTEVIKNLPVSISAHVSL